MNGSFGVYFSKRSGRRGNTGENLLLFCERRLDSVLRLAGFTKTRPQARQGVGHGHFLLNGKKHDVPSTLVNVGDAIHVIRRQNLSDLYREFQESFEGETADWLTIDVANQEIIFARLPTTSTWNIDDMQKDNDSDLTDDRFRGWLLKVVQETGFDSRAAAE